MPQLAELLTVNLAPQTGGNTPNIGSYIRFMDQTGIEGAWNVSLDRTLSDDGMDSQLASYTTSLATQGLQLKKTTAPIEKLIIDKVDKIPTAD